MAQHTIMAPSKVVPFLLNTMPLPKIWCQIILSNVALLVLNKFYSKLLLFFLKITLNIRERIKPSGAKSYQLIKEKLTKILFNIKLSIITLCWLKFVYHKNKFYHFIINH